MTEYLRHAVQVHGAVCEADGHKLFTDVTLNGLWTGWSGFADTFDDRHRHQVFCAISIPDHLLTGKRKHVQAWTLRTPTAGHDNCQLSVFLVQL